MARHVDAAVIGAGSAGLSALSEIQKKTDSYVIINAGPYGTSCARVACMPSKVLIEAADACHTLRLLADLGVEGIERPRINRAKILERVKNLRDGYVSGMLRSTENLGDRNISGTARFKDARTLEVNGEIITADKIVIAVGSSPVFPEPWKKFAQRILTTDDLFYLSDLPDAMGVIGLGPSGLELAQALSRIGIRVSAFEEKQFIGGLTDPQVNDSALSVISQEVDIHIGVRAGISEAGDKLRITGDNGEILVDRILLAIGRKPNTAELGLENLGIELDGRGMPPFNPGSLQVGDLPVFIAGDANYDRPLLHEAVDEGHIAGYNAVHEDISTFGRRVPLAITFSEPNIVLVGKSHAELDEDTVTGSYDFSRQSRARMSNSNHGLLHLYADRKKGTVLGAEMAAPAGEHLGHLLAAVIQQKMTVFEMLKLPFYHPVVEEGLRTAVRAAGKQVDRHFREGELLLCESAADECIS